MTATPIDTRTTTATIVIPAVAARLR